MLFKYCVVVELILLLYIIMGLMNNYVCFICIFGLRMMLLYLFVCYVLWWMLLWFGDFVFWCILICCELLVVDVVM